MIVTDDPELASLARSLRNQGRATEGAWLSHVRLGYNYRLSDINCALGTAQLARLDELLAARARVAEAYRARLADEPRLRLPRVHEGVELSWFVFVVRLADEYDRARRDRILDRLREMGIGCSNYFAPIHLQPYYLERFGYAEGDFPVCEAVGARTIALPFHHEMTEALVDRVCGELIGLL